jgi:hypothetical protein
VVVAVGAKHALADQARIAAALFFTDEAVRDQLMGLPAMRAGLGLQLHGLLVYRFEAGVIGLHGTGQDKKALSWRVHDSDQKLRWPGGLRRPGRGLQRK